MYYTYLFTILAHVHLATSLYNGHASGEPWWGNIHHLVQLIKLANKEEYLLIPTIATLKQNLKLERHKIKWYLYSLKNPNKLLYFRKPENVQRLFNSLKSSQINVKLTRKEETLKKGIYSLDATSHDLFMSMNSLLHIHHLYGLRLTTGYVYDTTKGGFLNSLHSSDIGIMALSRKMHYRAVEWTELSQNDQIIYDLQSAIYSIAVQEVRCVQFTMFSLY